MKINNIEEAIFQYEILRKSLSQAFQDYDDKLTTQDELILSVYRVEGYPKFSIDNEGMEIDKAIEIKFAHWLFKERIKEHKENNKLMIP